MNQKEDLTENPALIYNAEMTTLIDQFNRRIDYVRLSVTDRCDLRCFYCMPEAFKDFEEPEHWLSFDEIERLIRVFSELGVKRVRLTGGEPLVRKNLPVLAQRLSALPLLDDLSLSTNATRLAKQAEALRDSGITRINVSLDTLKPAVFKRITKGKLEKVLDGLMVAKQVGLMPIKINMVVMKGINDQEVEDMVEFCIEHGFTLRFIETMPVGDTGREAQDQFVDLRDVRRRLEQRFDLVPGAVPGAGPARYVQVQGTGVNIGFITPISQHFCETCNRVRIAVDGSLYLCLGQEHSVSLRPIMRSGVSDDELKQVIKAAIDIKPERHEFNEKPQQVLRFMSMTGG